jgi:hypothetical protein
MKKKEKKKEKKKKDIVIIEIDFAAFVSSGGSLDSIARSLCWTLRFLFLFLFCSFFFLSNENAERRAPRAQSAATNWSKHSGSFG